MSHKTDQDIIRELGRAEQRNADEETHESERAVRQAVDAVVERFGESGMDLLAQHWTSMRADIDEIAYAEINDPARYVRVALDADRLDAIADEVKTEIVALIADGTVPSTIQNFGQLHDHLDANELGGLADQNADVHVSGVAYIQESVDAWMKKGRPSR